MTVITEDEVLRKGVKIKSSHNLWGSSTLQKQNHLAQRKPLKDSGEHMLLKTIMFSHLAGSVLLSLTIIATESLQVWGSFRRSVTRLFGINSFQRICRDFTPCC